MPLAQPEVEWIFVHTLADLERFEWSRHPYELRQSAGLLRKLLMDSGGPLAVEANRRLEVPLVFRVRRVPGLSRPSRPGEGGIAILADEFDGGSEAVIGLSPGEEIVELSRNKFLAEPVGRAYGEVIRVSDVIGQGANVEGGVHTSTRVPRSPREQVADFAFTVMRQPPIMIEGMGFGDAIFRAIVRVTVRALTPLRDAIVAGNGDQDEPGGG